MLLYFVKKTITTSKSCNSRYLIKRQCDKPPGFGYQLEPLLSYYSQFVVNKTQLEILLRELNCLRFKPKLSRRTYITYSPVHIKTPNSPFNKLFQTSSFLYKYIKNYVHNIPSSNCCYPKFHDHTLQVCEILKIKQNQFLLFSTTFYQYRCLIFAKGTLITLSTKTTT